MNSLQNNLRLRVGLVLTGLVLSGLLAACGDNPTATPTVAPPTATPVALDAKGIAKLATEKINNLNSVHFIIDIKSGEVMIYNGITFKHAEGDLTRPDKYRAKLRVVLAIAQVDAETVGVQEKQWILLPNLSKDWQPLPSNVGFKASVLFDPNKGLSAVVSKIQDISQNGSEMLKDVDCYRLKGVVSGPDIAPLTAGTLGKNDVNFEVWIGKKDFITRQVTFKEISTDTKASDWQLNFSDFDKPVDIKSPVPQ